MDRDDAQARIARQASDEERRAACDVLIDNSGTPTAAAAVVDRLWTERLAPFAANLAAGRPAAREAGAIAARRAGDAERLVAKPRHGTGEEFPLAVTGDGSSGAPITLALTVPDAGSAEALSPRLTTLGFPRRPPTTSSCGPAPIPDCPPTSRYVPPGEDSVGPVGAVLPSVVSGPRSTLGP